VVGAVSASPARSEQTYTVAICERDDCAFKHRGVTPEATDEAARRHCSVAGHTVAVYEGHRFKHRWL
jgi:hypothetical protein